MQKIPTISGKLRYADLLRRDVIPDVAAFASSSKSCRFPIWVYRSVEKFPAAADQFETFYCLLTMKMLGLAGEKSEGELPHMAQIRDRSIAWETTIPVLFGTEPMNFAECQADLKKLEPKLKQLQLWLQKLNLDPSRGQWPIAAQKIRATASLLGEETLGDICACRNFKKKAPEFMLEMLAKAALIRESGGTVNVLSVILPLQQEEVRVDIRSWDSAGLLAAILEEAERSVSVGAGDETVPGNVPEAALAGMGFHVEMVPRGLTASLTAFLDGLSSRGVLSGSCKSVQFYLQKQYGGTGLSSLDLNECKSLVQAKGLRLFSHSPLYVNLSNPVTKNVSHSGFIVRLLKTDLELCRAAGGRGSVVHCGRPKKDSSASLGYQAALTKMEETIRRVLPAATPDCPLLLETPAGDKGEVCTNLEDLAAFYSRFREGEPLKICVDTCHVWGAGYWPLEYLERWALEHGKDSIGLVHFNDSRRERAARKDEHAWPGEGHIGLEHLIRVALWCEDNEIPFVHE